MVGAAHLHPFAEAGDDDPRAVRRSADAAPRGGRASTGAARDGV